MLGRDIVMSCRIRSLDRVKIMLSKISIVLSGKEALEGVGGAWNR